MQLDSAALQELRVECERAKRKLSSQPEAVLAKYFPRHNLQYKTTISRARFEDLCADLFRKVVDIVSGLVATAKVCSGFAGRGGCEGLGWARRGRPLPLFDLIMNKKPLVSKQLTTHIPERRQIPSTRPRYIGTLKPSLGAGR